MCEKWCVEIVGGNFDGLKKHQGFYVLSRCNGGYSNNSYETPLSIAISTRNVECCKYLLDLGADPSAPCLVCGKYDYPIHRAIFCKRSIQIAELLFLYGANMQQKDSNDLTIYEKKADKDQQSILDHITQMIKVRCAVGWVLLCIGNGWSDIISLLIERGGSFV